MIHPEQFMQQFSEAIPGESAFVTQDVFVRVFDTAVLLVSNRAHEEEFKWFYGGHHGVVFRTNGGFLALVINYESPLSETSKAAEECKRLIKLLRDE